MHSCVWQVPDDVLTTDFPIVLWVPQCGVPFEDIEYESDTSKAAICINWQLSKDPKTGHWLSDTMYFKQKEEA